MRENVMNLEVVLADGRIINTAGEGRRTRYYQSFACIIIISRLYVIIVKSQFNMCFPSLCENLVN